MITNEQFKDYLALDHENPGVEFKGPCSRTDERSAALIIQAAIGMSNRRDGGLIILGIRDRGSTINLVGITDHELDSWRRYDHVADLFAAYTDPPIIFDTGIFQVDGKNFTVLQVCEFAEIPVICKKDFKYQLPNGGYEYILRRGAYYIRGRHKPETKEISSVEEMRALVDLAVEKGVRKFVTQAQRAGMSLSKTTSLSDKELFEAQRNNWTSPLIEVIRSRGYWQVVIRPETFMKERIQYPDLFPLLQKTSVDLRGWDFPSVCGTQWPERRGSDWIGGEVDLEYMRESWRLYQSAQFMQVAAMREDWPEKVKNLYFAKTWKPGELLYYEDVVYRFTEIFLFVSRLALTDAFAHDDHMHIDVLVGGLQGRYLYSERPLLEILSQKYQLDIREFSFTKDISRETVIATPKDLALEATSELCYRAGYQPTKATFEELLSRLNTPL